MAQTSALLCQQDSCREPLLMIRYGHPHPLAGVTILCLDPIKALCPHCGRRSEFKEAAKAR